MATRASAGRTAAAAVVAVLALLGVLVVATGATDAPRGVDAEGGTRVAVPVTAVDGGTPSLDDLDDAAALLAERAADSGAPGSAARRVGSDQVVVDVAGDLPDGLAASLAQRGAVTVRAVGRTLPPAAPEEPAAGDAAGEEPAALDGGDLVDEPVAWAAAPDQASLDALQDFRCPVGAAPGSAGAADDLERPVLVCDVAGTRYLLSSAVVGPDEVDGARSTVPVGSGSPTVELDLDGQGTDDFADLSRGLVGTQRLFAVVLDGTVVSAPRMTGLVTDGRPTITGGGLDRDGVQALADLLDRGALPVLPGEPTTTPLGAAGSGSAPYAAGGLLLGALVLVVAAAALRRRTLAVLALASLAVGSLLEAGLLLLLAEAAGLVLDVPVLVAALLAPLLLVDGAAALHERVARARAAGQSPRGAVDVAVPAHRRLAVAGSLLTLLGAALLHLVGTGRTEDVALVLAAGSVASVLTTLLVALPLARTLAGHPRRWAVGPAEAGGPDLVGRSTPVLAAAAVLGTVSVLLLVLAPPAVDVVAGGGTATEVGAADPSGAATDARPALGTSRLASLDDAVALRAADDEFADLVGGLPDGEAATTTDVGPDAGSQPGWRDALGLVLVGLVVVGGLVPLLRHRASVVAAGTAVLLTAVTAPAVAALLGAAAGPATASALVVVLAVAAHAAVLVVDAVERATTDVARARGSWTGAATEAVGRAGVRGVEGVALLGVPLLAATALALVGPVLPGLADALLLLLVGVPTALLAAVLVAGPLLVRIRARDEEVRRLDARATRREPTGAPTKEKAAAGAATPTPAKARAGNRPAATSSGAARRPQPQRKPRSQRGKR